jgi:hypothetical protein
LETTLSSTSALSNYFKKLGIFILILMIAPIIASVYGVIHDQVTYTISPEYYTKFKFGQFGLETYWFGGIRNTVAITGIMATWWVGLMIGFVQGLVGMIHKTPGQMLNRVFKAFLLTILITFITGCFGYLFAVLSSPGNPSWWFPDNLEDKEAFITVGYIHNSGYMGGLLGMIGGIILQVRMKGKIVDSSGKHNR